MNSGQKITLFSVGTVGAIGSVFLLSKFLKGSNNKKKKKKLSKKEIILRKREEISFITNNIMITNGDNNNNNNNIFYCNEYFDKILIYLTTFDYLNTICYLSKYHYLYLSKYNNNFSNITFNMLYNESYKSWNLNQIKKCFNNKSFINIYDFMYKICNNWKYNKDYIEQMICIPFIIPNINIVKYWFNYISNKTHIPIRHLSFRTLDNNDNNDNNKKICNYFISALENPFELNLFLWIIVYNLYQLNIELNKNENKNKNIVHSDYFGFEHKLQEWMVFKHEYIMLKSDICGLLKLYNLIINNKEKYKDKDKFNTNMIYILCIMFKVIFHNTELHIVRLNKLNDKTQWIKLEKIFLNNLYNIITFIQYVIQINNNNVKLLKLFKSLLKKSNIKMVNNILKWFLKVNHHKNNIFYTSKENILSLNVLPIYFQLIGLNTKEISHNKHKDDIAIWISS